MNDELPVLYSFRRCPYAMRARMAILSCGLQVQLREVVLREMPASLLEYSPKGTVPVLLLPDGRVIEESRDIVDWALAQHEPDDWLQPVPGKMQDVATLLDENDTVFKTDLDHYKYAVRYPEHPVEYYRAQGERFFVQLEQRLATQAFLFGERPCVADVLIFPFVRQFVFVDRDWFDAAPYPQVQAWLEGFLCSPMYLGVMQKYPQWHAGDAVTVFP